MIMICTTIIQNNNKIENVILEQMNKFIFKNKYSFDNKTFEIIDKDGDGLIRINMVKFINLI